MHDSWNTWNKQIEINKYKIFKFRGHLKNNHFSLFREFAPPLTNTILSLCLKTILALQYLLGAILMLEE